MVNSVMKIIHENENHDSVLNGGVTESLGENAPWEEKEPWIRELVTVLMYNEILMLRRKKNRYIY
jgi:hypothetical protein